jgi:hypothetical protein
MAAAPSFRLLARLKKACAELRALAAAAAEESGASQKECPTVSADCAIGFWSSKALQLLDPVFG